MSVLHEPTLDEFVPQGMYLEPADMLILSLAFDIATDRKPMADRSAMARSILQDGERGERNVEKLCAAALVAALSPAARFKLESKASRRRTR